MKRWMIALLAGALVFATVLGLAASLGVSSETLGAGNSAVVACQAGALTASYDTVYDASLPGYEVGVVTVSGLDTTSPTNCASKSFKITLTGAGNVALAEITGTTPASGTSFTANFTAGHVAAAGVTGIHIVIAG